MCECTCVPACCVFVCCVYVYALYAFGWLHCMHSWRFFKKRRLCMRCLTCHFTDRKSSPHGLVVKTAVYAGDRGRSLGWEDPLDPLEKWQPTLVLLPGKSHAQSVWWAIVHGVTKELDTTYQLKNKQNHWSWSAQIKHYFLACLRRYLWVRLAFQSVNLVKRDCPPYCEWTSNQLML